MCVSCHSEVAQWKTTEHHQHNTRNELWGELVFTCRFKSYFQQDATTIGNTACLSWQAFQQQRPSGSPKWRSSGGMAGGPRQPRVVRWPAVVAGTLGIRLKSHGLRLNSSWLTGCSGLSGSDTNWRFLLKEVCVDVWRANRNYSHIVTKDTCNTQEANQLQTGEQNQAKHAHKTRTKEHLRI